jgi:hypothetical protein
VALSLEKGQGREVHHSLPTDDSYNFETQMFKILTVTLSVTVFFISGSDLSLFISYYIILWCYILGTIYQ